MRELFRTIFLYLPYAAQFNFLFKHLHTQFGSWNCSGLQEMSDEQSGKVMPLQTQKSQKELRISCQTTETSGTEKPENSINFFRKVSSAFKSSYFAISLFPDRLSGF
jgi:hypothetical protein